ncbi:hypothetical protein BST97_02445 [Nonlabens spongiae]|uniref:Restriction endonuclease n=1 Tax=Nonlabens spongiae TaxID=331648 RepID=A0A1W6MHJ7_9FLAO|nr:hypothetical protein [Nonlabens spongiae]ARN76949.1 hypothetical protein BST97_02445 [Nonlabens spongiae]
MKNDLIQVFEYERIAYKGRYAHDQFDEDLYKAFQSYHERFPDTPFFSLTAYGVKFTQYVGAIRVGNITIEVLPKAGKSGTHAQWQGILLEMLKKCHLLQAKQSGTANLKLKANSILELYFELFIVELEQLIHRGLIKKYYQSSGQQLALKGALLFNQQIAKNLVHKERFYTRHTIYSKDHLLHQILHEAIFVISHLVTSSALVDRIKRVQSLFPEVRRAQVNAATFDKIPLSRKHQPYQTSISIAKLILLNYRPDIKSGRKDLLAIMFDMNKLWEEYVLVCLRKEVKDRWAVNGQRKKSFWYAEAGYSKSIKPDILLTNGDTSIIIDTKWKIIDDGRPSDNDLKQMYVYNHYWDCDHSFLVYPRSFSANGISGRFSNTKNSKDKGCEMIFLDVHHEGRLNQSIGNDLIEEIKSTVESIHF